MVSMIAETILSKLNDFVIQEADLLSGVEKQVEVMEKELRMMYAVLQDVEASEGLTEYLLHWNEIVETASLNADNAIEKFITSTGNKSGFFVFQHLIDRHQVGMQLNHIKASFREMPPGKIWDEMVEDVDLNTDSPVNGFFTSAGTNSLLLFFQHLIERNEVIMQSNLIKASFRDSDMGRSIISTVMESGKAMHSPYSISYCVEILIPEDIRVICSRFLLPIFLGERYDQALWQSLYNQVDSIKRNLSFMETLSEDVEAKEEVALREKIWVLEMKDVADHVKSLHDFLLGHGPERRRFSNNMMSQKEVSKEIEQIKSKIVELNRKKRTYGIEISVPNIGQESVAQNWQDKETSISDTCNAINFKEQAQPGSSNHEETQKIDNSCILEVLIYLLTQKSIEDLKEQVESVREDFRKLCALLEKFPEKEKRDQRLEALVEEIQEVAQQAKAIIELYDNNKELKRRGVFERFFNLHREIQTRNIVANEIDRIKSRISDISRRKLIHDMEYIRGRRSRSSSSSTAKNLQGTGPATPGRQTQLSTSIQEERNHMEDGIFSILSKKFFNWLSDQSAGNLEDQVKLMETEIMLMQALLEDFQATEKPSRRVKVWLEEIRGIVDDAEDVIKTYRERSQKDLSNYEDMIIQNKIANGIRRVMNKIHDVSERREASNSIFHSLCQRRPPPNIIGFDEDVRAIKKRILTGDGYRCIISIVGEEGTGKTTLAKLIYSDDEVMNHFTFRAWISVPQENSDRAVLQDIQKQVMDSLQQKAKWNMGEPLAALDGRYLIILDDIRKAKVLDFLRTAFPDKSNGSRIVITTQEMAIALHADSNNSPHEIQLPNEEESWSLFTGTLKVEIPPELEYIGKEFVRSCGRVRQNLVHMGNLLSKNAVTSENWSRVLKQFNKGRIPWLKTQKVYMETPRNLRKCLDYFRLFPDDFEIPERRLITLWVAEGFVNKRMDDEPPEHIARGYLKDLIDKEMVEVVKEKFDGDVTCRLSKEGAKFLQDYAEATSGFSSSIHGPRRFADHYDHKDFHFKHIHGDESDTPLESYYADVLSFLSFDPRKGNKPGEDVRKFLLRCISSKCFLLLRVLDLERVFRPKFPKVFDRLLQLRYLGLRWTYLEELPPFVSNLLKLQTLDVTHTYISTLPHSIWKMQRLRHLYLSESYRSRFEPKPNSSSLRELQTLWGVFVDEESPVKNGLKTLLNLRKLGLACRIMLSQKKQMLSQIEAVADWILELKDLESLRLRSFDELGKPWYLPLKDLSKLKNLSSMYLLGRLKFDFVRTGIPESLTYLTLSASRLKNDPMQMLQHLHNLKKLRLFSDSFVGKTMCCSSGIFLHLEVLKVWNLEHLVTWNMAKGALPALRDLEIRSCRQLKILPKEVQCMKNLRILRLTDMLFQKSMHCYSGSFPQLLELKLENLKHLQIWTVGKEALPQLSHLEIKSCSQLRMLPKGLQHKRNLKVLKVKNMPQEFTNRLDENRGLDRFKIAHVPTREII